jgi:DNA-binding LacI/PurR family transcriptional regulator
MIAECGYDQTEEEELIKAFLAHRVSGLILHNTEHSAEAEAMIRQSGVPVVENGNLPRRPLDMVVSYSNREASMAMTLHLGRLGYKKIAFASLFSANNDRSRDRIEGYLGRIALASFDDVDLLRHVSPAVTTLRLPRYDIGERSAQMLLSGIMDGAEHLRGSVVDLKFEIIQRNSA